MTDAVTVTINTYNKTASEYVDKVQRYAPVPEREKFVSLAKPGGNILDAGCGSGRDANHFASKGFTVTGIDLSTGLLSYAREHAHKNATFIKADLRNIPLTETFDGIWACASLLHLARKEMYPILIKFRSLLTPGGTLFLLMKEGTGEKLVTSGTIEGDTRFFTYYSALELKALLKRAGFSVTEQYTWDQKNRNPERPSEIWISTFVQSPLI